MNHTDVINELVAITNYEPETCEAVLKAFEEESGGVVMGKLFGKKFDLETIGEKITQRAGVSIEVCKNIMTAFEQVLEKGLNKK